MNEEIREMKLICLICLLALFGCSDKKEDSCLKMPGTASERRVSESETNNMEMSRTSCADMETQIRFMTQYLFPKRNEHKDWCRNISRTIMSLPDGTLRGRSAEIYCDAIESVDLNYFEISNLRITLDRYYLLVDNCRELTPYLVDNERIYELTSKSIQMGKRVLLQCEEELQHKRTSSSMIKTKNRKGDIETALFIFISRIKDDYLDWGLGKGVLNSERYDYWKERFERETSGLKRTWGN